MERKAEDATMTAYDSRDYDTCAFSKRIILLLILGASVLSLVAIYLFAVLASNLRPHYSMPAIVFGRGHGTTVLVWVGGGVFTILLLTFGLSVLHEYCHGLAFRWAGATPRYGAKMLHNIVPVFYAASPGFRMSCRQFRVVLWAPTVIVNLLGILAMWPPTMLRYVLVLPLGIHLAGCLGDWWMLAVLRKTPADSPIEDTPEGFRYRRSAGQ